MTKARSNATAPNAKGTLVVGNGTDASTTLAVASTAGYVLTVDSAEATGLKWAAAGSSGPAFRAVRITSDQVTTEDAWTKVQFNSEDFDTDSCYDPSTNYRFTPNKAGYYLFNVVLAINTNEDSYLRIYKNGSNVTFLDRLNDPNAGALNGGALLYANGTTDYFEVFVYMSSATSRNVGFNDSFFSGVWIRS